MNVKIAGNSHICKGATIGDEAHIGPATRIYADVNIPKHFHVKHAYVINYPTTEMLINIVKSGATILDFINDNQ